MEWFEARQEERVQVPESSRDKLRKGHTWVRKYDTLDQIFDLYRESGRSSVVGIDPEVAAIDIDEMLGEWDPNETLDDDGEGNA